MLIVTGTIAVLPADLPQFLKELGLLAAVARRRDGNFSYDTAVLDPSAGRLLVAERWRNRAALAQHLGAEDTLAFIGRWQDRMTGEVREYDVSNERSLAAT